MLNAYAHRCCHIRIHKLPTMNQCLCAQQASDNLNSNEISIFFSCFFLATKKKFFFLLRFARRTFRDITICVWLAVSLHRKRTYQLYVIISISFFFLFEFLSIILFISSFLTQLVRSSDLLCCCTYSAYLLAAQNKMVLCDYCVLYRSRFFFSCLLLYARLCVRPRACVGSTVSCVRARQH